MAYTFGARLDDDSYALTTIDEDQGTASTKGEINGVPFEGGGGSSDFSTANLSIINNSENGCLVYAPFCTNDETFGSDWVDGEDTLEYPVVIPNNGKAVFTMTDDFSGTLTVSGYAEKKTNKRVNITGDCTITIS